MDIDFKDNETFIPVNQNQNQNHRHNTDSGSESAFNGSWSSSSSCSFLTTSFGSDFDSNEADLNEDGYGDDSDEFMAQLTRQMADYMLEENDDTKQKRTFQEATHNQNEKQPRVEVVQSGSRGRKGKYHRHEQMYSGAHRQSTVAGAGAGSGMRAIFLGGFGSRNVGSGTGVFLPRSASDATDHTRKKPGYSTVLVPTRVLQALEQHFQYMESLSPSNKMAQTHRNRQVKTEKTQESDSIDRQDSKLPKEWIY